MIGNRKEEGRVCLLLIQVIYKTPDTQRKQISSSTEPKKPKSVLGFEHGLLGQNAISLPLATPWPIIYNHHKQGRIHLSIEIRLEAFLESLQRDHQDKLGLAKHRKKNTNFELILGNILLPIVLVNMDYYFSCQSTMAANNRFCEIRQVAIRQIVTRQYQRQERMYKESKKDVTKESEFLV